jgi:hypothetical protein
VQTTAPRTSTVSPPRMAVTVRARTAPPATRMTWMAGSRCPGTPANVSEAADAHLGSRRGPVTDRATTRIDSIGCERIAEPTGKNWTTPQVREPALQPLPWWGSRVRIRSSAPRSVTLTSVDSALRRSGRSRLSMSWPWLVHDLRQRVAGHGNGLDAPSRSRFMATPRVGRRKSDSPRTRRIRSIRRCSSL